MRSPNETDENVEDRHRGRHSETVGSVPATAHGRRSGGGLLCGLALAGCSSSLLSVGAPPGAARGAEAASSSRRNNQPPPSREHQRILAAYNGAYEDPKLEALLNQTVAKLVAASERPDMHYQVTILNSAAVNAFALPTGQLYVTRGLIALANDTSELASVLSHEMSHVIARHAAIREDQARQVALVSRVVQDVLRRSGDRRARAGEIQDRARELLARAGIRG